MSFQHGGTNAAIKSAPTEQSIRIADAESQPTLGGWAMRVNGLNVAAVAKRTNSTVARAEAIITGEAHYVSDAEMATVAKAIGCRPAEVQADNTVANRLAHLNRF